MTDTVQNLKDQIKTEINALHQNDNVEVTDLREILDLLKAKTADTASTAPADTSVQSDPADETQATANAA